MSLPGDAPLPGPASNPAPIPGPPPGARDHEAQIERVLAETDHLDNEDVSSHVAKFDALHGALSDALNSIDSV